MDPLQTYRRIAEQYSASESRVRVRLRWSSILRLAVFLLTAFLAVHYFDEGFLALIIALGLVAFLFLVRRHLKLKERLNRFQSVKNFAERESRFLQDPLADYDGGEEFVDADHPYTYDLGIFGKRSIFGYLNRTVTFRGKEILASKLKENTLDRRLILAEREKLKEFSDDPEFIFNFLAALNTAKAEKPEALLTEAKVNVVPNPSALEFIATRVLPVFMIGVTSAFLLGYLSWSAFTWLLLPAIIPVVLRLRKHNSDFFRYEKTLDSAGAYKACLSLLLSKEVRSEELLKTFSNAELERSVSAIHRLERIKEAIDARNNIFVGIVLNILLLWDFQHHRRLVRWHRRWSDKFETWREVVHRMEADFSFSLYMHNHPDFIYPELTDEYSFTLEGAKHLLLGSSAVANPLDLSGDRRIIIVTGANMAGKSTYLRTVGTGLVLAMCALPVPAEKFRFKPTRLFTSMLTSDSLSEGESYFFNELSRLKALTEILESGQPVFIVLDEILKGTNSVDKAEGSKLFVEKLLDLPAKGIIATHDLSLCQLENMHPKAVANYSFEVVFEEDELHFDYKLREGVCQNMNARFLLRKMGLSKN
jgi:hypothetical protein